MVESKGNDLNKTFSGSFAMSPETVASMFQKIGEYLIRNKDSLAGNVPGKMNDVKKRDISSVDIFISFAAEDNLWDNGTFNLDVHLNSKNQL